MSCVEQLQTAPPMKYTPGIIPVGNVESFRISQRDTIGAAMPEILLDALIHEATPANLQPEFRRPMERLMGATQYLAKL